MIDSNYKPIEGDTPEVDLTLTKSPNKTTDEVADETRQYFSRSVGALFGIGYHPFYENEETPLDDNEELIVDEVELTEAFKTIDETDSIIKDLLNKVSNKTDVISKTPASLPGYKDITSPTIRKALIDLLKLFVQITEEDNKIAVVNELITKLGMDKISDDKKKGLISSIIGKTNSLSEKK